MIFHYICVVKVSLSPEHFFELLDLVVCILLGAGVVKEGAGIGQWSGVHLGGGDHTSSNTTLMPPDDSTPHDTTFSTALLVQNAPPIILNAGDCNHGN